MTETDTTIVRKPNGQFVSGTKAGPGRKVGSRNKLTESFATDLKLAWEKHGADVLDRVARDEPGTLLKVVASLMPKDIRIDQHITLDPGEFLTRFERAQSLLGNAKTIDHAD